MNALAPEILKARLSVVLALRMGEGVVEAVGAWMAVEPDVTERMGACMLEAITQAVDDDRAFEVVLIASSAFHAQLAEVVDGGR